MTNKKPIVIPVAILLAIVLFCAIMCLAVHFSFSHDSAFAYDITQPSVISGTFTQYIQDGLNPSLGHGWELYNFNSGVTSHDSYAYVYPIDSTGTCGITYPLPNTIQEGHQYLLRAHLLIPDSSNMCNYSIALPYGATLSYVHNKFTDIDVFKIYTPDLNYGSAYLTFYSSSVGASFGVSFVEFIDLSLLNFGTNVPLDEATSSIKSAFYHQYFGYDYHIYTSGVPASEITTYSTYSHGYDIGYDLGYANGHETGYDEGYEFGVESSYDIGYQDGFDEGHSTGFQDGYNEGHQVGFDEGFTDGVNYSRGISYTFSESDYVPEFPSYPLFENVIDNYWAIWGITDDEAWLKSSVGFAQMFGYTYAEMKTKQVSFQWFLPTVSVSEGHYSYGSRFYNSSYVTFDDATECIVLSDSEFPVTNTYNIYIEIFSDRTMISTSWFGSSVQNSQAVPNFYNGFGIDLYALSFSLNDPSATVYADGFNKGVAYADNRLNVRSVSYNTGYNRGVDYSGNFTFPSVISAAIDVPIKTLTSLLNFELFGTNLNTFVLSLLSFGIVIGIVKLILGR